MRRSILAVALVLLMIPSPALSTHTDGGAGGAFEGSLVETGDPDVDGAQASVMDSADYAVGPTRDSVMDGRPQVHDEAVGQTGVPFIDRNRADAVATTNDALVPLYDATEPTLRPVQEQAPTRAITLFHDRIHEDGRYGAIGDWMNDVHWDVSPAAAHGGSWGIGLGDQAGYPTDTQAVLVTPELDLRTGYDLNERKPTFDEVEIDEVPNPGDLLDEDTVPLEDIDDLAEGVANIVTQAPNGLQPYEYAREGSGDPLFIVRYWMRHNLGAGKDGVQVWVLEEEPQDSGGLQECKEGCTVLDPIDLDGDATLYGKTEAFVEEEEEEGEENVDRAYTGTQEWGQHYIDLTDWADERVWLAFVFRSQQNLRGDFYFSDDDDFDPVGFYGFHLDDVELRGTPSPINLQVHELWSPREAYPGAPEIQIDTDDPVHVKTLVRNTGTVTTVADITVKVTSAKTGYDKEWDSSKVEDQELLWLRPGESFPIDLVFDPVGKEADDLKATVTVEGRLNTASVEPVPLPAHDEFREDFNERLPDGLQVPEPSHPLPGGYPAPLPERPPVPSDVPLPEEREGAHGAMDLLFGVTDVTLNTLFGENSFLQQNGFIEESPIEENDSAAAVEQLTRGFVGPVDQAVWDREDHIDSPVEDDSVPRREDHLPQDGRVPALEDVEIPEEVGAPEVSEELDQDIKPEDNAASAEFMAIRVHDVLISTPRVSAVWVQEQQPISVTVDVRNVGTVKETVTIVPYLADVDDGHADASSLILKGEGQTSVERVLTLNEGEGTTLTWDIDTSRLGRYRFFARSSDQPPFGPGDFGPIPQPVLPSVHKTSAPTVDGVLDSSAWNGAVEQAITFGKGVDAIDATLRVLNTDDDLYLFITVPEGDEDDVLELFFDDHADRRLQDGEDALLVDEGEGDETVYTDLRYVASSGDWVEQDEAAGAVVRQSTQGGNGYTIEIQRPLNGEGDGGLTALDAVPGEYLGLAARLTRQKTGPDLELTHPHDVDISEEGLEGWPLIQTIRDPAVPPVGNRVKSAGFGVGTGPPPLVQYDFTKQCDDFNRPDSPWGKSDGQVGGTDTYWTDEGSSPVLVGHDTWGCSFFGPEGRELLFMGLQSNGNPCGTAPCLPYAGSGPYNTQGVPMNLRVEESSVTLTLDEDLLAHDPYLVLRHQYATEVGFRDHVDGHGSGQSADQHFDIKVWSVAYVTATVDDKEYYLTPGIKGDPLSRHWDTEETVGVRDPRFGPTGRDFHDGVTTTPQVAGFCDDRSFQALGPEKAHPARAYCGWWHPSGWQQGYLPTEDRFPVGAAFSGSPWKVDRIPLTGMHWRQVDGNGNHLSEPYEVDLVGRKVTFGFHYVRYGEGEPLSIDPNAEFEKNLGWRIESVAITDGPGGVRDLTVEEARLDLNYDPEELGVGAGPGAGLAVVVDVTNTGILPIDGATVHVECLDADDVTGTPLASDEVEVTDLIDPAATVTVTGSCTLPGPGQKNDAVGKHVRVRARVSIPNGDDLPLNDAYLIPGILEVRQSQDLAAAVTATPDEGSSDQPRFMEISVENRGNVPVHEFELQLLFKRGAAVVSSRGPWTIDGTLGVGETLHLTPPVAAALGIDLRELRFDSLDEPGSYTAQVTTRLPSDVVPENDRGATSFRVVTNVYSDDFGGTPTFELPSIVSSDEGRTSALWSFTTVKDSEGKAFHVARAGDGTTIPAHSDSSLVLPTLDLTSASSATLTLKHAYDLEDGYDAARVEVSTDGGTTWEPAPPVPSTRNPLGYPNRTIVGSNPLLGGQPEGQAIAFTGSSGDDPTADALDFIVSEFRLGDVPSLQARQRFADFPLDELALQPTQKVIGAGGDEGRTDPTWSILGSTDGWVAQDVTQNLPRPHSGSRMWWSGSTGESVPEHRLQVTTSLERDVVLPSVAAGDRIFLDFWDWRAGWQDGELSRGADREGTGGAYSIQAQHGGGTDSLTSRTLERRDDGWTHRRVELTSLADPSSPKTVTILFEYVADPQGSPDAATTTSENNQGWFLDDLSASRVTLTGGSELLPGFPDDLEAYSPGKPGECLAVGPFQRTREPSGNRPSAACWSLVRRAEEHPIPWHIEAVDGPDEQPTKAWRISDDSNQGYPHVLDTRLVTPSVDLRSVSGREASLSFNHRYEFEEGPLNHLAPIDGGVIEVQVFDEATGTYGPWMQVLNAPAERIVFAGSSQGVQSIIHDTRASSGYPSLYLRGDAGWTEPENVGIGSPFQAFPGICRACTTDSATFSDHPVGYAFSGKSGWTTARFDISPFIGEKVRFAFHAFSNPSDARGSGADPLLGWDITDVAVDAVVFDGKPAQVRLRVGTDGSVLDGHWTIDALEVSGNILDRNVAVTTAGGDLAFPTADGATLDVEVANLGRQPRGTIALGVRALQNGVPLEVEVSHPGSAKIPNSLAPSLLAGESAYGPVALTGVGAVGSTSTWRITVPNPPVGPFVIQARVLEDNGPNVENEDGDLVHVVEYGIPREAMLANTRTSWTVRVEDTTDLSLEPSATGLPLRIDGAGPGSEGDVTVHGVLHNDGTIPAGASVSWRLRSIPDNPEAADLANNLASPDSVVIPAGGQRPLSWPLADHIPAAGGRFRFLLDVNGGPSTSVEFPVGLAESVWSEGFAASALPDDWVVTDNPTEETVSSVGKVTWRADEVDGFLLWGVHPFGGEGYCGGENLPCDSIGSGFSSRVQTGPIQLDTALNGRALLSLRHSYFFGGDDGGRMEVATLDDDGDVVCWIPLEPTVGTLHDGVTHSTNAGGVRHENPLGESTPVFQGPAGSIFQTVQTRYDLAGIQGCHGEDLLGTGAEVLLGARVGIRQASHRARPGWQIDDVGITSGGVRVGPSDGDSRTIELVRNAPKRIAFTVENLGVVDDEYALEVFLAGEAVTPSWLSLEQETVPLPGGGSDVFWMNVRTPESLPAGRHLLRVVATSIHDASSSTILDTFLDVDQLAKPDLSVRLQVDENGYQQGSVANVPARIENTGQVESKETTLVFEVVAPDGTVQPLETLKIPPVCAPVECGPIQSRTVLTLEWPVPEVVGDDYLLRARIDPEERLLDFDLGNNVAEETVRVVPLQLPDLEVTSIEVVGEGVDGRFVEDGSVVTVRATVTNVGHVASQGATARILAGTVTLTEATLPVLAPGATHVVEAVKVVSGGTVETFDVLALVTAGSEAELRVDNDELLRSYTIRTHDLGLSVPEGLAVRVGGVATVPVKVRNDGNALERLTLVAGGPEGWTVEVLTPQLIVPPGGSLTGLLLVRVPDGAEAGEVLLPVSVEAAKRTVASTLAPLQVATILEPADVALDLPDLRSGDGTLTLSLRSRSNVDQVLRLTDALGWVPETLVELAAGEETELVVPLRIPTDTPPGAYDDPLILAPRDGSWERVEAKTWTVLPTAAFDAVWTETEGGEVLGDGTRAVTMRLRLTNLGNVPTNASIDLAPGHGTRLEAPSSVFLEPLAERTIEVSARVDERLPTPRGDLLLNLTGPGAEAQQTVAVPDLSILPDLRVVVLSTDQVLPRSGQPLVLRAIVRNDGLAPAPASDLHVYRDGSLVGFVETPPLAVGEEVGLNLTWVPSGSGRLDLLALADGGRDVLESHEDNNGGTRALRLDEPDLTSTLLRSIPAASSLWLLLGVLALALVLRRRHA